MRAQPDVRRQLIAAYKVLESTPNVGDMSMFNSLVVFVSLIVELIETVYHIQAHC